VALDEAMAEIERSNDMLQVAREQAVNAYSGPAVMGAIVDATTWRH
jgi:hypothetical protein